MNQLDFSGQTAVVTGGGQGIGLAVVKRLLASGARVASWDMNAEGNKAAMTALGGQSLAVECDVSDYASVQAALAATENGLGPVDVVVNSAGIAGPNATVEDYDNAMFERIVAINLTGTYFVNKAVVTGMKARNYGRILNIASVAGKEGNPNASAYSASKAGVIGFTKSLGKELAGFDIGVNCVTPAAARTPIFDQMAQTHIDYMLSKIPRNRLVLVEEISATIAFMVSEECSFTTGFTFDIYGGRATY